jgi:hypothetical protein
MRYVAIFLTLGLVFLPGCNAKVPFRGDILLGYFEQGGFSWRQECGFVITSKAEQSPESLSGEFKPVQTPYGLAGWDGKAKEVYLVSKEDAREIQALLEARGFYDWREGPGYDAADVPEAVLVVKTRFGLRWVSVWPGSEELLERVAHTYGRSAQPEKDVMEKFDRLVSELREFARQRGKLVSGKGDG